MKTRVEVTRKNYGIEKAVKHSIKLLRAQSVLIKTKLFNVQPPDSGCTRDPVGVKAIEVLETQERARIKCFYCVELYPYNELKAQRQDELF